MSEETNPPQPPPQPPAQSPVTPPPANNPAAPNPNEFNDLIREAAEATQKEKDALMGQVRSMLDEQMKNFSVEKQKEIDALKQQWEEKDKQRVAETEKIIQEYKERLANVDKVISERTSAIPDGKNPFRNPQGQEFKGDLHANPNLSEEEKRQAFENMLRRR